MIKNPNIAEANPVPGMIVKCAEDDVHVLYKGYGLGLLIHQAPLADKIVDRVLSEIDADV